jgi:hypothetical protein
LQASISHAERQTLTIPDERKQTFENFLNCTFFQKQILIIDGTLKAWHNALRFATHISIESGYGLWAQTEGKEQNMEHIAAFHFRLYSVKLSSGYHTLCCIFN